MANPTRKNSPPIKVYCLPTERAQIESHARAAGMTLSTYLLHLGLSLRTKTIIDHQRVEELARINGDLGRLGGLLKLWLTDDPRAAAVGAATIRALLFRIEDTQAKMQEVMRAVVLPAPYAGKGNG